MATVRTSTFSINRLTRDASPAPRPAAVAGVNETPTVRITFVYSGLTGNTKIVNGVTWSEATGTFTFTPDSIEIAHGDTADIKFKMDNQGSTNGWKLVQFIPKASNPSGGPVATNADSNGDIDVTDSNTVAGTYSYGVYLENPSQNQYASFDPTIIQDGGG